MTDTSFDTFIAEPLPLLIGGDWRQAQSGATLSVVDPATGLAFAHAAAGDARDVDAAVTAARAALGDPAWAMMPVAKRRKLLLDLADAIERDVELLAMLEVRNAGMPMFAARAFNIGFAVEALRYAAGWVGKLGGETLSTSFGHQHVYTVREPVGVVGAIIPWNVPFAMAAEALALALATGCTLVLKPAELTPLSAIRLGQLALDVGVPPGVFNIVNGEGAVAGAAMVAHPGIDKIAFTGSTDTGKAIMQAAAATLKRVTLELGGKSAFVIMPDADVKGATMAAAAAIFSNSGQICAAGSRLFVHADVFDAVMEGLAAIAGKMPVGSGLDPDTKIGPLVSERQLMRVCDYVESAVADGARIVAGGKARPGDGFFMTPTVLADTRPDMRAVREEIFGPVLCARRFDDSNLAQIAALANDSDYGLSAYVWTKDISAAHSLARMLKAGTVIINGGPVLDANVPSGGFKQSGIGRQHGREGFEAYLETKSVVVNLDGGPGH